MKVIHWELCKKFKFYQTDKWCIDNPESVQENEKHEILWDFELQTDHLILARRPDLAIVNNKKKKKKVSRPNSGFCSSDWPHGKTERKRKER